MWEPTTVGLLRLPSGRFVRGRALRRPVPDRERPDFGLYLLGKPPGPMRWEERWIRWPDFWLPTDQGDTREALRDAWARAAEERVEVACGGGRGRTGTALACLAVLDGIPANEAVGFIREYYDARAVEMPWQQRYVAQFGNAWR